MPDRGALAVAYAVRLHGCGTAPRLGRLFPRTVAKRCYENRIHYFREKNPFYHYQLAQKSYAEGDYFVAERRIKKALTIDKHQHRFYRLLALVQLKRGLHKRARRSLESAAKLARKPQDRALYSRKLALLAGASS